MGVHCDLMEFQYSYIYGTDTKKCISHLMEGKKNDGKDFQ